MKRLLLLLMMTVSLRAESIDEAVTRATSTPPFDRAIWFVRVEDASGDVVFSRNADLLAIPASVRKLFAMSAAVECLGPDAQFPTELYVDGEDVVIRGTGDPSFGSDRYGYDPGAAFDPFIEALKARGIKRVRNVIADVSEFDRVTIPYQWKVGNLNTDSAAAVDAIAYDENEVDDVPVSSPALFAAGEFRDQLLRAGIKVDGDVRTNIAARAWGEPLATIKGPYLRFLLTTVLSNSHNLFAEMLYKRISTSVPASYEGARERERTILREAGVGDAEFRFVDGSGLAPDDLVTASAVTKILRWMDTPPRQALFRDVLAKPGVSGTLRVRLDKLTGRLWGKTGTVAGVNSLAAILTNSEGKTRYVAVIVNHHIGSSTTATKLIDAIMEAAANF